MFLFILSQITNEAPKIAPIVGAHDYLPTIGAIIISCLTGFFSWWKNNPRNKNDQFQVFMDESSEFREEMRNERGRLNQELKETYLEIINLKQKIQDYEIKLNDCSNNVYKQTLNLENSNQEINKLRNTIATLTDEITKLKNPL